MSSSEGRWLRLAHQQSFGGEATFGKAVHCSCQLFEAIVVECGALMQAKGGNVPIGCSHLFD